MLSSTGYMNHYTLSYCTGNIPNVCLYSKDIQHSWEDNMVLHWEDTNLKIKNGRPGRSYGMAIHD